MGPRPTAAGAATGTAQVRGVPQYKYAPGVRNPQQHMPTQPQVPMQQVLMELIRFTTKFLVAKTETECVLQNVNFMYKVDVFSFIHTILI